MATALQRPPQKGSLDASVPIEPLIYGFHEITQVYGTTIKEMIHEEFGDGIMSAIDFEMTIARPRPEGRPGRHHPRRQVPVLPHLVRPSASR